MGFENMFEGFTMFRNCLKLFIQPFQIAFVFQLIALKIGSVKPYFYSRLPEKIRFSDFLNIAYQNAFA